MSVNATNAPINRERPIFIGDSCITNPTTWTHHCISSINSSCRQCRNRSIDFLINNSFRLTISDTFNCCFICNIFFSGHWCEIFRAAKIIHRHNMFTKGFIFVSGYRQRCSKEYERQKNREEFKEFFHFYFCIGIHLLFCFKLPLCYLLVNSSLKLLYICISDPLFFVYFTEISDIFRRSIIAAPCPPFPQR